MQIRNNFLCYLFSPSGEYEAESVSHATPLYRRRSPQPPSTHRFEIKIQKKIIKIMSGHNVLTVTISVIAGRSHCCFHCFCLCYCLFVGQVLSPHQNEKKSLAVSLTVTKKAKFSPPLLFQETFQRGSRIQISSPLPAFPAPPR